MQTFLPYADFAASAAALDPARLGKQRVETLQSLRALVIPDYGWRRHPAIRMWMGYVPALTLYGLAAVDEWTGRGHADSTRDRILEFAPEVANAVEVPMPPWLGDAAFHLSHQSNLIHKAPDFYRSRFPAVPEDLPYLWPEPAEVLLPQDPVEHRLWIWRTKVATGAGATDRADDRADALYLSMPAQGPSGRASPKWQRQVTTFIDVVREGDAVAIADPEGKRYRTGVVGELRMDDDGSATRAVHPAGWLQRTDFDHPALLQDPRTFFPVPRPGNWQV